MIFMFVSQMEPASICQRLSVAHPHSGSSCCSKSVHMDASYKQSYVCLSFMSFEGCSCYKNLILAICWSAAVNRPTFTSSPSHSFAHYMLRKWIWSLRHHDTCLKVEWYAGASCLTNFVDQALIRVHQWDSVRQPGINHYSIDNCWFSPPEYYRTAKWSGTSQWSPWLIAEYAHGMEMQTNMQELAGDRPIMAIID